MEKGENGRVQFPQRLATHLSVERALSARCASQVSVVMEQALRMLHECGMPMEDLDFINCDGNVMHG